MDAREVFSVVTLDNAAGIPVVARDGRQRIRHLLRRRAARAGAHPAEAIVFGSLHTHPAEETRTAENAFPPEFPLGHQVGGLDSLRDTPRPRVSLLERVVEVLRPQRRILRSALADKHRSGPLRYFPAGLNLVVHDGGRVGRQGSRAEIIPTPAAALRLRQGLTPLCTRLQRQRDRGGQFVLYIEAGFTHPLVVLTVTIQQLAVGTVIRRVREIRSAVLDEARMQQ